MEQPVSNSPKIPLDIDSDWLRSVFNDPGLELLEAEALEGGYMSQLLRVHLCTTDNLDSDNAKAASGIADSPPSVIIKMATQDQRRLDTALSYSSYQKEVRFYRDLATGLAVRVPHCYQSEISDDGKHFVLVLEDLAAGKWVQVPQQESLSREQTRQAMAVLARLHSWQLQDSSIPGTSQQESSQQDSSEQDTSQQESSRQGDSPQDTSSQESSQPDTSQKEGGQQPPLSSDAVATSAHSPGKAADDQQLPQFRDAVAAAADGFSKILASGLEKTGLVLPDAMLKELMDFAAEPLTLLDDFLAVPQALIHGDYRSANLFFRHDGGELALIDWGDYTHGPAALDLTNLLVTSLSAEQRQAWEDEAIAHYTQQLADLGVHYSQEQCQQDCRMLMPVCAWLPSYIALSDDPGQIRLARELYLRLADAMM